jgi:hypothetical protein
VYKDALIVLEQCAVHGTYLPVTEIKFYNSVIRIMTAEYYSPQYNIVQYENAYNKVGMTSKILT